MAWWVSYLILGLFVGALSGIVGIGGGVLFIPVLVYYFKMPQHMAQGTTLALMVPPIGLLAVMEYYKKGYCNIKFASFMALGFFIGGYFGAKLAIHIPDLILKKVFGGYLLIIAIKMLLSK